MSKNVRHSKGDPNWTTPGEGQKIDFIALIRECLGGSIGFDPFSSHVANEVVRAEAYLTPAEDGFKQIWQDRAHINPPGLLVKKAWMKLCSEIMVGRVTTAMWTGFSVEQLNLLADPNACDEIDEYRWARGAFYPLDFSTVFLRKRISFVRENGTKGSPSHGNYITGINVDPRLFTRTFGYLGQVVHGGLARKVWNEKQG